jgi:hypothetical protein
MKGKRINVPAQVLRLALKNEMPLVGEEARIMSEVLPHVTSTSLDPVTVAARLRKGTHESLTLIHV